MTKKIITLQDFARSGQKALREKNGLKTPEQVSVYMRHISRQGREARKRAMRAYWAKKKGLKQG